jgi:signal transduction histidine kinase
VSHDLNQEIFIEKDNFKTLLKQFIAEQNNYLTTNYELQIDKNINWDLISSEIKMHLYRIIQEATRNSNKYAKATKAIICFTIDENQLCLSITDNGVGFDSEKIKEGIGLLNMQQRIQSLNGTLSIDSKVNKGTTIYIRIPL